METNKELMRTEFETAYGPKEGFAWLNPDNTYKSQAIQDGWEIWQKAWQARAALSQSSEAVPSAAAGEQVQAWDTYATQRLRSIVDLLGLQPYVPHDSLAGYEFAVLGHVRREIERLKAAAQPTPAQGDAVPVAVDEADLECHIPPFGWRCTRGAGHSGPCAAVECPEDVAAVERGMKRLADATRQSSADAVDAARIFTYKEQPGNVEAWRFGQAVYRASKKPGGDLIDTGLQLLLELQEKGYGIIALPNAIAAQGGKGGA